MPTARAEPGFQLDLTAIAQLKSVPSMLEVIVETTGLRVAFIAHITYESWVACAVHDRANFGLKVGDRLDIQTTL